MPFWIERNELDISKGLSPSHEIPRGLLLWQWISLLDWEAAAVCTTSFTQLTIFLYYTLIERVERNNL